MSKLHELLAVETEVASDAKRALRDAVHLFTQGRGQFSGLETSYRPLEEGGATFPTQVKPLSATVSDELEKLERAFGRWIDVAVEKEQANQSAHAVLKIGGYEITLSATALLNLEGKLKALKDVYEALPVLPATTLWGWNESQGCYTSPPTEEYRTQKRPQVIVKYNATEHHPAQTEIFMEDVRIGSITKLQSSGAITNADRTMRLERLNELIRLVKRARQRANEEETNRLQIAKLLFEYIDKG